MTITLPIYYTQEFKTKDDKTFLVGMNWYRNAHYHISNQVKTYYHDLVVSQLDSAKIPAQFTLDIVVHYKNPGCDGSNIASIMEKFTLDSLQSHGTVTNDNVQYHLGTTWSVGDRDKTNPRVEITIKETK